MAGAAGAGLGWWGAVGVCCALWLAEPGEAAGLEGAGLSGLMAGAAGAGLGLRGAVGVGCVVWLSEPSGGVELGEAGLALAA